MYRRGIPPSRIAVLDAAAVTTVRYHLQVAKKLEPELEAEHAAALPKPVGPSTAVLRMMQDVVDFYGTCGRLPSAHVKSPREATLGRWLYLRRREAQAGTLSPAVRDGLDVIPGWDLASKRKAEDEARWQKRLQQVKEIRDAGGEWPRHQRLRMRTNASWACGCTPSGSTTTRESWLQRRSLCSMRSCRDGARAGHVAADHDEHRKALATGRPCETEALRPRPALEFTDGCKQ